MKLVIEHEHVQEVVMMVGAVEIPLTREQTVQMLFGKDWVVVPAELAARSVKRMSKSAGRAPLLLPPGPVASGGETVRTPVITEAVKDLIVRHGPIHLNDIRARLDPAHSAIVAKKPVPYLAGMLARLVKSKVVKRAGSKGTFLYSASGAIAKTKTAPVPTSSKRTPRLAAPGGPTFVDMVIATLAKMKNPSTSDEIKIAVEKKYPGETTARHHSSVAATMIGLGRYGYIKRTGPAGKYKYKLVPNWEKLKAKREAKNLATRTSTAKKLGAKRGKSVRKPRPSRAKIKTVSAPPNQLVLNGAISAPTPEASV